MRKYKSQSVGRPPKPKSAHVTKSMRSNRSSGTRPDLILSRLLRKRLYRNSLPGSPDFVYPKKSLAVFVHGCFWHRCSKCKPRLPKSNRAYWKRKFERNVELDKLNNKELRNMGWKVLTVWEHELKNNPSKVRNLIKSI